MIQSLISINHGPRRKRGVGVGDRWIPPPYSYLHLDVEHDDAALGGLLLNGLLGGAVAVAAELGVLDEAVLGDEVLELGHGDEEVVGAVLLAGAGGTRRVRDGQGEAVRVRGEQAAVQGALAHARGARDDERAAVGGLLAGCGGVVLVMYVYAWLCTKATLVRSS